MTIELTQYKPFCLASKAGGFLFFAGPFATMLLWQFQNGFFSQS